VPGEFGDCAKVCKFWQSVRGEGSRVAEASRASASCPVSAKETVRACACMCTCLHVCTCLVCSAAWQVPAWLCFSMPTPGGSVGRVGHAGSSH
jgi:hypothetical protein